MNTSIVWFKTDLRLHDNETLIAALLHSDRIVPVYCFDDADYATTPYGFKRTGAFRAQFILQALEDLDRRLRLLGSGLVVVKGNTASELQQLVAIYQACSIYTAEQVAPYELLQQQEVAQLLQPMHCTLQVVGNNTLYHTTDLPFSPEEAPEVFTAFRQKTEAVSTVRECFSDPFFISSPLLPELDLPTLSELQLTSAVADTRGGIIYNGGETSALQRVQYYFEESRLVSTYKETRNQLVGADYATRFSAWLAIGCLSPRFIYHKLKEYEQTYGANDSTYWVVFELLWRDYFSIMMKKHGNKYFLKKGIKKWQILPVPHNHQALQSWVNGQTGVDFVDANMRELQLTGFMSNRGRQNVASYLCNDLKIDWRYGAAYFEEQLIDYDVCSNWGNWAYIAGVGNDPRPNRYFNIRKQADQYDADKKFRELWLSDRG